jgi:hypothetical protein
LGIELFEIGDGHRFRISLVTGASQNRSVVSFATPPHICSPRGLADSRPAKGN